MTEFEVPLGKAYITGAEQWYDIITDVSLYCSKGRSEALRKSGVQRGKKIQSQIGIDIRGIMNNTKVFKNTPGGFKEVGPQIPGSDNELFMFFNEHIWNQGKDMGLPQTLSVLTGIPYLAERDTWDYGRDYARENHADILGPVDNMLDKISVPKALWNHHRTLCLVIEDEERRVGITVTSLKVPFIGLQWDKANNLLQVLKSHLANH